MKREIESCKILGMGALGMLYGSMIERNGKKETVSYLMDEGRIARHRNDIHTVNGREVKFDLQDAALAQPSDLIIVAVKYGALRASLPELDRAVGPDTIIISVMNGIDSEEILSERFDRDHILGCVAIGMDAMREGSALTYTKTGKLQIGVLTDRQEPCLAALSDFFDRVGIAYEVVPDIRKAMWNKYMLNIGINQACTVYSTDYAHATSEPILSEMEQAMEEVILVAKAEGVNLTEEDLKRNIAIEKTLNPESYPSMRQDIVAGRKTEVEMFSGILIRLAEKYGIPVPVNRKYYKAIKELEEKL